MPAVQKASLIVLLTVACVGSLLGACLPARADQPTLRPDPLAFVSPSRDFDALHTRLDIDLDIEGGRIAGSVTHSLRALKSNLGSIRLNCVGLSVEAVTIDGRPVDFEHPVSGEYDTSWIEIFESREPSEELVVYTGRPLRAGDEFDLTIRYSGAPKQGLYFIAPEKGIPEKRHEEWSQGEGEDNRHWIPCFDYPNDKATFDGIFRVDKGNYVLSNGILVETKELEGKTEFHWRLDTPQVTYLIMVAAGRYDVIEEQWRGVSLHYVVPPKTDPQTVKRGYGLTADMMEFFSDYIGIDYPFKRYAQVVVQNFIYGGMENTTATVMNTRTLFDESEQLTNNQDGLVAHELAHQWWGDMVTCSEWSHLWLNEGFATYFQSLYRQHHRGDDAFRYQIDQRHRGVVERDDRDARPVVVDFFNRRDSRNSANVYVKGSSVLHMLRFLLGDDLFRESFRRYGERFKYQNAETRDFIQVVKETSGENLDWFFEQWIYLAGHPKLEVSKSWSPETRTLKLSIEQTQETGELTPVFRLPMDLEITCKERTDTHRIVLDRKSQDFYFSLPSKPLMVIVDKGDWTLKTLTFKKRTPELLYQLEHGDVMDQVRAIRGLADKRGDSKAVETLRGVLTADGFWGTRREAALALGKIKTADAVQGLLAGLEAGEARVRLAAAEAMGGIDASPRLDDALYGLFRKDPASRVRARAIRSLAKMESARARKACLEALRIDSHQDVIRNAGLDGLVTLEALDAIGKVKALATSGNRRTHRHAAITAYAKLAKRLDDDKDRERSADFLAGMLDDWYLRTRQTVVAALETLGEARAVEKLKETAQSDPVALVRTRAAKAAAAIEARGQETAKRDDLEAEVRLLSDKIRTLKKDLETLQARMPLGGETERLSRTGNE